MVRSEFLELGRRIGKLTRLVKDILEEKPILSMARLGAPPGRPRKMLKKRAFSAEKAHFSP